MSDPVIAVVDDDDSLRRSVRNFLTSAGLRVETFASAEAFLESAPGDFGCVVVDVKMPGTSGIELLRHLAKLGRRIPAVILTAHSDEEVRRQSRAVGAVAVLGKPFRGDALLGAVWRALDETGHRP